MNIYNVKGAQKTFFFLTVIRIIFTVRKAGWVLRGRIQFRKFNCLCKSQRPNALCAFCFTVLLYLYMCVLVCGCICGGAHAYVCVCLCVSACVCAWLWVRVSQQMLELFSHFANHGARNLIPQGHKDYSLFIFLLSSGYGKLLL